MMFKSSNKTALHLVIITLDTLYSSNTTIYLKKCFMQKKIHCETISGRREYYWHLPHISNLQLGTDWNKFYYYKIISDCIELGGGKETKGRKNIKKVWTSEKDKAIDKQ